MSRDLRFPIDFFDHPKVGRLNDALGDPGIVCLWRLFCWAGKHHRDGDLRKATIKQIERASEWRGEADMLVTTLLVIGFLEAPAPDHFLIHDWSDWQPWIAGAPEREKIAKAAADARWKKKGAFMHSASNSNAPSPSPSPSPIPNPSPIPSPVVFSKQHEPESASAVAQAILAGFKAKGPKGAAEEAEKLTRGPHGSEIELSGRE